MNSAVCINLLSSKWEAVETYSKQNFAFLLVILQLSCPPSFPQNASLPRQLTHTISSHFPFVFPAIDGLLVPLSRKNYNNIRKSLALSKALPCQTHTTCTCGHWPLVRILAFPSRWELSVIEDCEKSAIEQPTSVLTKYSLGCIVIPPWLCMRQNSYF